MSGPARFSPRAVLFDLDGTLLDTIADLADAANLTLGELGRPARSQKEIHSFVGKGIPNLVRRCMTEGTSATESEIEYAVAVFRRHYAVVNGVRTRAYPGVTELLGTLRERNLPLAVVTTRPRPSPCRCSSAWRSRITSTRWSAVTRWRLRSPTPPWCTWPVSAWA
jgi:phosphoglycolate phosphatase